MEIPDIKKQLSILTVLEHYNIKPDKHSQINCPFHQDGKPSCKVYPETNTFHCFGCGAKGDQIEFCAKQEGDKHKGILKATELTGKNTGTTMLGNSTCRAAKEEIDFEALFAKQQEGLPRSPKAQAYLNDRGLTNLQEVGYNSGVHWKKLKQCITFPLKNRSGNITSLYGRRITETNGYNLEYGKHYYSENRKGLYPKWPTEETEILIITEAIIDAATLLQCTDALPCVSILAAYGTNGLTTEHTEAVSQLKNLQEIIFFFDGDEAGRDGIEKSIEKLHGLLSGVEVSKVDTPENEDINSLYVNYGKEAIIQLIEERQPAVQPKHALAQSLPPLESSFSIENKIKENEVERPVKTQFIASRQLDISQPNKLTFTTETARYIIKGSLCKQLDKMLVSLDVQHLETAIKYRCRLDLYEEKQSRREAREAAEKLDLRSDLIENDLSHLTDLLEEHREKSLSLALSQGEGTADYQLTLAEQTKCKSFLKQDASTGSAPLIQRLNDLIGQSGIVGEENNRLFLFVIATSHKMPDTLHALIQGSSGSGKTHLLSKIASLMPPEKVMKFTRVTENSFYNYDEFFFRNKLVCLEDIDGLKEEALFAWRELISNNQLSSSTSQKDENGNIRSAQRIVRGPMASICATTHGSIYEDNMSRMFIIAVDESGEQTQKIMKYQSRTASGAINRDEETKARELLQNCVRMLKPLKVINPYADKIKLPPQAHKIRRLHELFLSFVKQVTLINQYQRKRDKQARIITEPEDLQTAVNIMFDSIFLKVDELDGSLRQFFESLKTYILQKENPQNYEFTQREIRHSLHLSKTQLHRYMGELMELEYIQQSGGYVNRGFRYKISYWDNIEKLRGEIRSYLLNQIETIKKRATASKHQHSAERYEPKAEETTKAL